MNVSKNVEDSLITIPLMCRDSRYQWDFYNLEQQIINAKIKPRLLLLCNPHNPIGRVWDRNELEQLLLLVIKYDLLVCSDDIHCDLILDSNKPHIPFASLNSEAASRTITLMGASKTYNIAGLNCAFAIVENIQLQSQLQQSTHNLIGGVNSLGLIATKIALTKCEDWHTQLISYLPTFRTNFRIFTFIYQRIFLSL